MKRFMPPWVMVNGIATSLILTVSMFLLCNWAEAAIVPIGTYNGDLYMYDDATLKRYGGVDTVFVITNSQKFNVEGSKKYSGAGAAVALDCSGHQTALIAGFTFDTDGKLISQHVVPQEAIKFVPIQEHTVEYQLYRDVCIGHPAI